MNSPTTNIDNSNHETIISIETKKESNPKMACNSLQKTIKNGDGKKCSEILDKVRSIPRFQFNGWKKLVYPWPRYNYNSSSLRNMAMEITEINDTILKGILCMTVKIQEELAKVKTKLNELEIFSTKMSKVRLLSIKLHGTSLWNLI